MEITKELTSHVYEISKNVYDSKLKRSEGIKLLIDGGSMNKNSAGTYINNFKCMIEGERLTRTNNSYSIEYFLNHIQHDYEPNVLSNALSSVTQHIDYYEDIRGTKMVSLREIVEKFSIENKTVSLIVNLKQLIENIYKIEYYLTDVGDGERLKALKLIKGGICFIAYQINEEVRFAPSKFLGYKNNTLSKYEPSKIDGRDTNKAINGILKSRPLADENLEKKYLDYCKKLEINPNLKSGTRGIKRKYWRLSLVQEFLDNKPVTGEFPEGRLVEKIHKSYERNSTVVQLAKDNFINKYGRLICQICHFDFEKVYGPIGSDFIEGHHTIAVSDMLPGHKSNLKDIAMLCSNCHRMVHRKRPWLTMDKLNKLIK